MAIDQKARARKRAGEIKSSVWFKLVVGDNILRMLPTPEGAKGATPPNWFEYMAHREVGPRKQTIRCGRSPEDDSGECWLCDVQIPKLKKKGAAGRAATLEATRVSVVQIASVEMDKDDNPKFSGPFLWSPSKSVFASLLSKVFGSKKRTYEDAVKGYNVTINRTGTTKNDTRYGALEADDEPSKVPSDLIKKLKPFSELKEIPVYDEAKQKAAYTGADAIDDDGDDDDDATDDAKPPKKKKGKTPSDDDDDDDTGDDDDDATDDDDDDATDDDDTGDDDDDDDAKPPKKKGAVPPKKKKKPADDDDDATDDVKPPKKKKPADDDDDDDTADDDDDDTADDDDDDDVKPPPKKKGKTPPKSDDDDDDDDDTADDDDDDAGDDDDGDDDDDAPPPPKKKKGSKAPPPPDDDDDDDPPPVPKPPKKKK